MNWKSPVVRLVLVLILLGTLGVGYLSYREFKRGERIQSEIEGLRKEALRIELENGDLSQKIMYFDSPDFQEREAKDKLGMRRQEEEEVLISGRSGFPETRGQSQEVAQHDPEADEPNYKKWWHLFFQ